MTKKIFLILSVIFSLLICHSVVFATIGDDINRGANDFGNEIHNSWNKTTNTVSNAGNMVASGISTAGNMITNTTDDFMGTMNNGNDNDNNTNNNDNDNRYTAERTATTTDGSSNFLGMNSTMLTWVVLAVLGVAIVSLVWYYSSQQADHRTRHDD